MRMCVTHDMACTVKGGHDKSHLVLGTVFIALLCGVVGVAGTNHLSKFSQVSQGVWCLGG